MREAFFFAPQAHQPKHLSHPAFRDLHAGVRQPLAQLHLGQVWLLAQPAAHALLDRIGNPAEPAMPRLRHTLLLTIAPPMTAYLAHIIETNSKAPRQLLLRPLFALVCFQNPATQIVGQCFSHRPSVAENLAKLSLAILRFPGYSYLGSALAIKHRCHAPRL
jgi:hypothetical protein